MRLSVTQNTKTFMNNEKKKDCVPGYYIQPNMTQIWRLNRGYFISVMQKFKKTHHSTTKIIIVKEFSYQVKTK